MLIARAVDWLEAGELRVGWSRPTDTAIVLGSGQREIPATDLPVLRRGTGGGAVVCDEGYLMLDVVLPDGHPLIERDVAESYRWLSDWLMCELAPAPIRAILPLDLRELDDGDRRAARLACFAGLGPYEVVTADGRKLVGLAQRRRGAAVLFQAAAYLELPRVDLAGVLDEAWLGPRLAQVATLAEVAPRFAGDPPLPPIGSTAR